jgi:hypothetical protein
VSPTQTEVQHTIGYTSLHGATATADSKKQALARLSILPKDALDPPRWLFYSENFASEAETVLRQVVDAAFDDCDSDCECACNGDDESAECTCEKHNNEGSLIAPASAVMGLIEQGCLWLLWQRIVLKARQHETMVVATEKSEQAYDALMAEEVVLQLLRLETLCCCVRRVIGTLCDQEAALQRKKKKEKKEKKAKAKEKPQCDPPVAPAPAKLPRSKPQSPAKEDPSQPVLRVVEAGGETFVVTDDVDVEAIVGRSGDDWVVVGKSSPGNGKAIAEPDEKTPQPVVVTLAASKPASRPQPPTTAVPPPDVEGSFAFHEPPAHVQSTAAFTESKQLTPTSVPAIVDSPASTLVPMSVASPQFPSFLSSLPLGADDDDDSSVLALALGSELDGLLSDVGQVDDDDVVQSQSRLLSRLAVAHDSSTNWQQQSGSLLWASPTNWSSPQSSTAPRPPPGLPPRVAGMW